MLLRAVPERALGALFGGAPVSEVLRRHLANLAVTVTKMVKPEEKASPTLPIICLPTLLKALRTAIQSDISLRTGNSQRLNECQIAAENLCNARFLQTPDIVLLDDTVELLFETHENSMHFKELYVKKYAEILAEIDPTLLVAWQLVRATTTKGQGKRETLCARVDPLTTLFVGPRFLPQPFAENHVHLGGVVGDEIVLAQLILGPGWPDNDRMPEDSIERLRRIRRILLVLVRVWSLDTVPNAPVSEAQQMELLKACCDDAETVPSNPTLDWSFLEEGLAGGSKNSDAPDTSIADSDNDGGQPVNGLWLLQRLAEAARKCDLQRAWTWLFVLLWRTYRSTAKRQDITRSVILLFIADSMVLRRQMIMDGSGLRRFTSDFFHSPLRKGAAAALAWQPTSMAHIAQCLFANRHDKVELKVSAASLSKGDMAASFARAAHARISSLDTSSNPIPVDPLSSTSASIQTAFPTLGAPSVSAADSLTSIFGQWHFCAHFNRVKRLTRTDLWRQARELAGVLQSLTPWALGRPIEPDLTFDTQHLVLPAQLIRGLDVVGDETLWSIERFAPMLRWLRAARTMPDPVRELIGSKTRPGIRLHLSVHAGEDYAHPISGLRHIDETVRFCEMVAGDSLGHALALGIPPDEWFSRHGEVLLSVDDHVDNLVWAWHEACQLSELPEASTVLPRLETRILRLLRHVSWLPCRHASTVLSERTLPLLYEAWQLRRNCPHKALSAIDQSTISDLELRWGVPDMARFRPHLKSPGIDTAEGLYVLRARREATSPTDVLKPLRNVRVAVFRQGHATRAQQQLEAMDAPDAQYLYDHDDVHDLRLMMALQDRCIERYALRGLSIETNPSSNVYIGQLQTHNEHPIFRWHPPNPEHLKAGGLFNQFSLRSRPMPVTINTDDPGVIPTTLRMEHHLMHEAAIDRGHTVAIADGWIEKLRQESLKFFDERH